MALNQSLLPTAAAVKNVQATAPNSLATLLSGLQQPVSQNMVKVPTAGNGVENLPNAVQGQNPNVSLLPNAVVGQTPNISPVDNILAGQQSSAQASQQAALQAAALSRLQSQGVNSPAAVASQPNTSVGSTPYSGPTGSSQEQQWIDQALSILHMSNSYEPGIANIIQHESSGNPNSVNNWDSNAKAGHPSQGLMQTIAPTFEEWALPGYNKNILDPVSNIIAGVRYAMDRYGKGMLLAGGRHTSSGAYEGY